ncbi:uncharacterized protein [Chelonus insularis]|uniref:uncharacterized protein n=1 Tax=Chelonus insularis TaxID=460826 RepID=UPI00158A5DF1|nr:uncharacterized protein LOC118066277 [Chelonus insularis]
MNFKSQQCSIISFIHLLIISVFLLSLTTSCFQIPPLTTETNVTNSTFVIFLRCNMNQPKDLQKLTNPELAAFFASFDTVITDIDGVLWQGMALIPGVVEILKELKNNNKQILLVTNNSIFPVRHYIRILQEMGYTITPDEIVLPSDTLIWYLQSIGFTGKALVIGSVCFKDKLINADIDIVTGPPSVEEDIRLLENLTKIDKDIEAVIVEFDFNVNWAKIIQAGIYLENKDVLFLVGASDKKFPASKSHIIIGGGYFQEILVNFTGRKPLLFGKPGSILKDFIFDRYAETIETDPKRVLFIGDSLNVDMKFADLCGFSKLWVGSGVDGSDVSRFRHSCEFVPDYYLPDLSKMPLVPILTFLSNFLHCACRISMIKTCISSSLYWFVYTLLASRTYVNAALIFADSALNNISLQWNVTPPRAVHNFNYVQLKKFFNSFDTVIIDINELLWHRHCSIVSATDTLKKFQALDKDILFISSNSIHPIKYYIQHLDPLKYYANVNQFITPYNTVSWYLEHTKFEGKVLTFATSFFKDYLMRSGINIATGPSCLEENFDLLENLTKVDKDIKAVILDFDFNMNLMKMLLAEAYLRDENVLFLAGPSNKKLAISDSQIIMGPGYFQDIIIDYTRRKPLSYARSGSILKEFIFIHHNITDPSRVLLIGNSLETDMKFAELCGFIKLWIGFEEDLLHSCGNGCEAMPDYYLTNLGQLPFIDYDD